MGAGIAEVFAKHGYSVVGVEADDTALSRGREILEKSTARAVKRGKLSEVERSELLGRVTFSLGLESLAEHPIELVVEAIPESMSLKAAVLDTLDKILGPDAILATNTSSLSVTELAVATARPSRVVGMHFFNPAPVQGFVEIVRTVVTDPTVVERVRGIALDLGKQPVVVSDKAGFIANALLFGYLNHAATMFEQQYATREDIDTAMRLGCGYPMGPLALLDLIGLDTAYEILDTMYHQSRDRLHAPAPVFKQLITAGLLGRKSGRGFYTYETAHSPVVVADTESASAASSAADASDIRVAGVVGSGTMAAGIVEVFARAGIEVIAVARSTESAARLQSTVDRSLSKAVAKERITAEQAQEISSRIRTTTTIDDVSAADVVVEAVVEELTPKLELFAELDRVCRPGAILATTTSSLPVIEIAAATKRAQDVVGLHFFNPAPAMKLVEVVSTVLTSAEVTATSVALVERLKKTPVRCSDRAGFIVNALLFPYLNDAVRMLEANYASADDIDTAMKLGCALPMGPFELLDMVGLDVSLEIQRTLYREFREPGYAPAPRLDHLVTAGYLGRKAGHGFRSYAR